MFSVLLSIPNLINFKFIETKHNTIVNDIGKVKPEHNSFHYQDKSRSAIGIIGVRIGDSHNTASYATLFALTYWIYNISIKYADKVAYFVLYSK